MHGNQNVVSGERLQGIGAADTHASMPSTLALHVLFSQMHRYLVFSSDLGKRIMVIAIMSDHACYPTFAPWKQYYICKVFF